MNASNWWQTCMQFGEAHLKTAPEQRFSWSCSVATGTYWRLVRREVRRLHENLQPRQLHDSRVGLLNNQPPLRSFEIIRAAECLTLVFLSPLP
jgi:hypothetical protein